MKYKSLYLSVLFLAVMLTGCQRDLLDISIDGGTTGNIGRITFTTTRADGVVSLAIHAPAEARSYLWIDLNADGVRAEDGQEDVTNFDSYQDYTLAKGVKKITIYGNVTYLGCASNQLTEVNVSEALALEKLNCPLNQLTSIDVSKNTALTHLDCSENKLSTRNVSSNAALSSLWCFNNQLSSLDVSGNQNLTFLDCSGNKLTSLDVSSNTELIRLLCYNNALTALDLSKNDWLNRLWLFGNAFDEKNIDLLIQTLKESSGGELWLSTKTPNREWSDLITAKGWTLK